MRLSKSPKGLSVTRDGNKILGQLYNTLIVKINGNEITLNNGGWLTMHTKKCMNLIARDLGFDFYVKQRKGLWYVSASNGRNFEFNNNILTFNLKE